MSQCLVYRCILWDELCFTTWLTSKLNNKHVLFTIYSLYQTHLSLQLRMQTLFSRQTVPPFVKLFSEWMVNFINEHENLKKEKKTKSVQFNDDNVGSMCSTSCFKFFKKKKKKKGMLFLFYTILIHVHAAYWVSKEVAFLHELC